MVWVGRSGQPCAPLSAVHPSLASFSLPGQCQVQHCRGSLLRSSHRSPSVPDPCPSPPPPPLPKVTGGEAMYDQRLFNQDAGASTLGGEDSYNIYDKPLFADRSDIFKHKVGARGGSLWEVGLDVWWWGRICMWGRGEEGMQLGRSLHESFGLPSEHGWLGRKAAALLPQA